MQIRSTSLLFFLSTLFPCGYGWAFESPSQNIRVSGFATLGYTRSGSENLGFRRHIDQQGVFDGDGSLSSDSIIGLQLDYNANDALSAGIQLVGKDRADNSVENSIEWAYVGYQWGSQWQLRAGRVGYDAMLSSEYRNVGFAHLWVRPPVEYYTFVTFFSLDGADLTWTQPIGQGTLRLKALAGRSKNNPVFFGQVQELELENIYGLNIGWESDQWRFRFSTVRHDYVRPGNSFLGYDQLVNALNQVSNLWPAAAQYADQLILDNNQLRYYGLGTAYFNHPWQVQSEISYTDSRIHSYPSQMGGYLSIGYQIKQITPYVLVAAAKSEGNADLIPSPQGIPGNPTLNDNLLMLHQSVQGSSDIRNTDQTRVSIGLRWDFYHHLALKAQIDHSQVGQHGYSIWDIRTPPPKDQTINTLSLALDWLF